MGRNANRTRTAPVTVADHIEDMRDASDVVTPDSDEAFIADLADVVATVGTDDEDTDTDSDSDSDATDTDATDTDTSATGAAVVDGPALVASFKVTVTDALNAPDTDRDAPRVSDATLDAIKSAWSVLRGRYRNDADGWLVSAMTRAQTDAGVKIGAGGLTAADPGRLTDSMILAAVRDALITVPTRTTVDPVEGLRVRLVALSVARHLLSRVSYVAEIMGAEIHHGDLSKIVDEADAQATKLVDSIGAHKIDALPDDTDPVILAGVKIARGRAGGGTSKVTGAPVVRTGATAAKTGLGVADHIAQAFGDDAVGTFRTIANLSKIATDAYPTPTGLNGRLSSRMFTENGTGAPKTITVNGRTFTGAMRDGTRGVVRTA